MSIKIPGIKTKGPRSGDQGRDAAGYGENLLEIEVGPVPNEKNLDNNSLEARRFVLYPRVTRRSQIIAIAAAAIAAGTVALLIIVFRRMQQLQHDQKLILGPMGIFRHHRVRRGLSGRIDRSVMT